MDNTVERELIGEISKQIYGNPTPAAKDKLLVKFGKESMF